MIYFSVFCVQFLTGDLGGSSKCSEFTQEICEKVEKYATSS